MGLIEFNSNESEGSEWKWTRRTFCGHERKLKGQKLTKIYKNLTPQICTTLTSPLLTNQFWTSAHFIWYPYTIWYYIKIKIHQNSISCSIWLCQVVLVMLLCLLLLPHCGNFLPRISGSDHGLGGTASSAQLSTTVSVPSSNFFPQPNS